MRNERPDPIDAAIDEAARRLVAGEPSSALRSSVRDRIGRRRLDWFGVPAWGAAALVVAVLIVGRALLGPLGYPVGRTLSGPAIRPTVDRLATNSDVTGVVSQTNDSTPTQLVRSETRQLGRRRVAATLPPDEEPIIPQITIEPLRTPPLTEMQITADVSSGVMPIDVAPLQIEPLLGQ